MLSSPIKYVTLYYTNGTHKRKINLKYGLSKHSNVHSEQFPLKTLYFLPYNVYTVHNIIYRPNFENIARQSQMYHFLRFDQRERGRRITELLHLCKIKLQKREQHIPNKLRHQTDVGDRLTQTSLERKVTTIKSNKTLGYKTAFYFTAPLNMYCRVIKHNSSRSKNKMLSSII